MTTNAATPPGRWVVVTDGGVGMGRSTLAAARALHAGGYRVGVAASRLPSPAARSHACSMRIGVPPVSAHIFRATIEATAARLGAVAVLATTDDAIVALDAPGRALLDKGTLAARAEAAGIKSVPGERFASHDALEAARERLAHPLVVKPADRSRFGAQLLADASAPLRIPDDGPLLAQPYLRGPTRAVAGVLHGGRLAAAVHQRALRNWPDPCGGASAAITTEPDLRVEAQLLRVLDGYDGIFMAQFIDGYLIDLNVRVYGSLPLATRAGVNLPAIWCDLRRGISAPLLRARPGIRYRRLDADVRAIVSRAVRTRRLPLEALVPRRGTAHGVGARGDVGPLLAHAERIVRTRARRLTMR